MIITLLITVSTVLVSMACFNNREYFAKLSFNPYLITTRKQYGQFLTHTFVHADWVHLLVNMFVFFSFGRVVESTFLALEEYDVIFSGRVVFILLYFGGAIIASLSSFIKHRNDPYYVSVGASGAVSAVLFTSIFYSPLEKVYFYGIIPISGILFGVLYLIYSSYMGKRSKDNINHDAHFWGAVYGFIFPVILDPSSLKVFINQLF